MNNYHPFLSENEEKEFTPELYGWACRSGKRAAQGWTETVIENMKYTGKPTWHLLQFRRNGGKGPIEFNY